MLFMNPSHLFHIRQVNITYISADAYERFDIPQPGVEIEFSPLVTANTVGKRNDTTRHFALQQAKTKVWMGSNLIQAAIKDTRVFS